MTRVVLLLIALASAAGAQEPLVYKPDFLVFAEGREVFERNCVLCHGARGDGNGELSKGLIPKPRSFREGLFKFRTTPWDKLPADADLKRTITGGLSGTAMGMFTQLRPDEVSAVIEYIKSFSRRWRKSESYARPLEPGLPPAWLAEAPLRAKHVQSGQRQFAATCAACHGSNADGKSALAASLLDVWKMPSIPSDLRQPHLRCGDLPADIFRVLSTGLNGTPMISFDSALTVEQRWEIAAYIVSLRPTTNG